jgi:hypothetical protein
MAGSSVEKNLSTSGGLIRFISPFFSLDPQEHLTAERDMSAKEMSHQTAVYTENSSSGVVMVKSAKDGV